MHNTCELSKYTVRFVNTSYRTKNAGIGLYYPIENERKVVVEDRQTIALGCFEGLTATHIEISAIQSALHLVSDFWSAKMATRLRAAAAVLTYVLVSNSQATIKSVSRPSRQSGQSTLCQIKPLASEITGRDGPSVRLQWFPAHAKTSDTGPKGDMEEWLGVQLILLRMRRQANLRGVAATPARCMETWREPPPVLASS